jgi:hypothetical protein
MRVSRHTIPLNTARNNGGVFSLALPLSALVLAIDMQHGTPSIYVRETTGDQTDHEHGERVFTLVTGESVAPDFRGRYIGTFVAGFATLHVFEVSP